MLKTLLTVLLAGILTDNIVLAKTTGICPFLGVSKKYKQAAGMGLAVIFVMLCASAVTWPIYKALEALDIKYLKTIVFILVIAALVQFVEIILKKYIPSLYKSLGVYLPLITTNCAVLGVAETNVKEGYDFITSMASSVGVGVGFLVYGLVIALMNKLNEKRGGVKRKSFSCDGCPSAHLCTKTSCSEITELATDAEEVATENKEVTENA